jgi:hypothetical protein
MIHEGIAEEHITEDKLALNALHFLFNLPKFRLVIEEITGCAPLQRFGGRIYRMNPTFGHFDGWHDDAKGPRLVGMSLNLSRREFQGGQFLLREIKSKRMLAEIANTGLGDAIIFRISKDLQHRVNEIVGKEPKTAFAGWFRPDLPDLFSELQAFGEKNAQTPAL